MGPVKEIFHGYAASFPFFISNLNYIKEGMNAKEHRKTIHPTQKRKTKMGIKGL